jgi:hypothetical protein
MAASSTSPLRGKCETNAFIDMGDQFINLTPVVHG